LTTGQSYGTDGSAETHHHIQDFGRLDAFSMLRHVFKGLTEESVTGENGNVFAVYNLPKSTTTTSI
jgi:hypothetical protein